MSEAQTEPPRGGETGVDRPPAGFDTSPSSGARGGVAIAVAALLLALVAVGGGAYLAWVGRNEVRVQRVWQVAAQGRMETLQRQLQDTSQRLARSVEAQESRDRGLDQALASLGERLGRDPGGWRVAQAKYLIWVANQRVQLSRDPATALTALAGADEELQALGDPAFRAVRERIAAEIAALRAVPQTDITGIESRLAALIRQVDGLPLAGAEPPHAGAGPAPRAVAPGGWRQALRQAGEGLRSLVVIRRTDHPPRPMLPPDQQYFLQQNLEIQLQTARLALLQGATSVYRDSLSTARGWVRTYYQTDAAGTQRFLRELDQLATAPVAARLPDLSGSLRLLRRVAAQRYGSGGRPATAPAAGTAGGAAQ
ncbi:MAG: uroporphyrinogen-III C-methyltransferase [Gammaproteobacteria bacterium]|nr:uroporphyrinogen-III C-methyltransferase [Gammaproteobacteria bacterium]